MRIEWLLGFCNWTIMRSVLCSIPTARGNGVILFELTLMWCGSQGLRRNTSVSGFKQFQDVLRL